MMQILEFAVAVITISISGVMSPGPLFVANVAYGAKESSKAGLKMACGHTIVELPLVILLGLGAISLQTIPQFRETVSFVGAVSLFVFAGLQIRSILKPNIISRGKYGPLLAGIIFSALNPFFLIWWFTIGFKLISDALAIWSFIGILIMFVFHIWMDFAWLSSVSFLSSKGKKILSNRSYIVFMIGVSCVLIYFGILFVTEALH